MKKSVSLLLALILGVAFCVTGAQAARIAQYPLSPDSVPSNEAEPLPERAVKGTADLNVYTQPGESETKNTSAVLAVLEPGAHVEMLKYDITGKWVRILYNEGNNAGWVLLSSLAKVE